MLNLTKKSKQNFAVNKEEKQTPVLNSSIKSREKSADYYELRNHVAHEYYYKLHGCSVRIQQ